MMHQSNKTSFIRSKIIIVGVAAAIIVNACSKDAAVQNDNHSNIDAPSISQGRATPKQTPLLECNVPGWRITTQGEIKDSNGEIWDTPASVNFTNGPKATDIFNECNNVTFPNADALTIDDIPLTEIDSEGEVFVLYFFGDNYSEIYVNSQLIGVDPVPYWPFNTSAVRFKAKRPFLLGAKLVDWEENLNLGSELMRGVPFHNGDGGFVGILKDKDNQTVAITDESWRVQFYYASPLLDPDCFTFINGARNSNNCTSPEKQNAESAYAARWPVPENWANLDFDDSDWTFASLYTNEEIGGSLNRPAYSNFTGLFDAEEDDAQFIWSSNLLLDNLVLARKVIE